LRHKRRKNERANQQEANSFHMHGK
jgi:hypothetical protein